MNDYNLKSYQSWGIGILIALGMGVLLWFLSGYIQHTIKDRLPDYVQTVVIERTNGLYTSRASVSRLHILHGNLELTGFQLQPTPALDSLVSLGRAPLPRAAITANRISISSFNWWHFLWSDSLAMGGINLQEPDIQVTSWPDTIRDTSAPASSDTTTFHIQKIRISQGSFSYIDTQTSETIQISDINLQSRALNSKQSDSAQTTPSLLSDLRFQTGALLHKKEGALYHQRLDSLQFSAPNNRLHLFGLKLLPQYSKDKFGWEIGHESDRIKLSIPRLELHGWNWQAVSDSTLRAARLWIDHPQIHVYRDNRPPMQPNRFVPMPQHALQRLPWKVHLDTLSITGADITYEQLQAGADSSGYITFNNLDAQFTPVSNLAGVSPGHARIESLVMDRSRLSLDIDYTLNDPAYTHSLKGQLEPVPMSIFNRALTPISFVSVTSGTVESLTFNFTVDKERATGVTEFYYTDLSVELTDNPQTRNKVLSKKFQSMLANTFIIKKENMPPEPRVGSISFQRNTKKSIFHYWWNALLSGIKPSIGIR